jgi:hypothetical protein
MVVANVGGHGLKGKTALRKLLVGKQFYMNTDAFGPPVASNACIFGHQRSKECSRS